MSTMAYDGVAAELLRRPPAEFVRARAAAVAAARAGGDRALADRIASLRRPTTSAWAVNLLVHRRREAVEDLVALGAHMRQRQLCADAAEIRELGQRRTAAIASLAASASEELAARGVRTTPSVRGEIEQTLQAALADKDAAQATLSGTLVTYLHYAGLGFDGATTTGPAPRRATARPRPSGPVAPAEPETAQLAELVRRRTEATAAQRLVEAAAARLADAEQGAAASVVELEAAQLRFASAQRDLLTAAEAEQRAEHLVEDADRRVVDARRQLEDAEQHLAELDS